jgi:tetratricopeptide (TPR) repeat protein
VVGPKLSPEENLELAKRQLVTAIEEKDFFKQHLALNSVAELAYRNRENSKDDYDLAIECWETQVAIAEEMMLYLKNSHIQSCINSKTERRFHAPSHPGFERLSIVAAKEGRFKDAIKLCKTAKNQGWNGDWDKRIARYEAQEAKQAKAHGKAQTRTRAE